MPTQTQRTVVVTGASRGLGLEWVKQLSQDPQNFVIGVVRDPDTATMLKPLLGPKVVAIKGDITDLESLPSVAERIKKSGDGKVDVLINNAGVMVGAGASFELGISKSTPQEWEDQFKVNVTGQVFFTIALLPLLEKSSEKKIINVASMLGDLGFAESHPELNFASYAVTKAGITMATVKFHQEFKGRGFTFLALNPGWVNTEIAGEGTGAYAPLQPEQSIRECLSFVNRSTPADSGKFWSLDGRPEAVTH